jgi:two-component system, OmpR family, response regulator QseB
MPTNEDTAPPLRWRDISLHPDSRRACQAGRLLALSRREFDLLHALMRAQGSVVPTAQLEGVLHPWGTRLESNAVQVHVHHLRRKLGDDATIETVRGMGYRLAGAAA